MLDCPICASGNIEHKATHPLTMTNDEAQDWLLAQHNAAPGPPDPARFGAAIRAIRAKAIADAKEWSRADTGELARLREATDPWRIALESIAQHSGDPGSRFVAAQALRADTGELARPEDADNVSTDSNPYNTGELARLRETIEAMSGDAADLHDLMGEAAGMRTVLRHLLDPNGRIHDSGCGTCDAGRAFLAADHELPSAALTVQHTAEQE